MATGLSRSARLRSQARLMTPAVARAVTAAASLVALASLSACSTTADSTVPPPVVVATAQEVGGAPGTSATTPADAPAGGTADAPTPAVPPGPSMTQIEPAAVCTIRRPLTDPRDEVPLDVVFPGSTSGGFSSPDEVVPGPDAADLRRCPGELPPEAYCDQAVPWSGLGYDAFLTASGARRSVDGYLLTMPQQAGNEAPPESSPGTKVVTYRVLDFAAGDPGGLVDYLDLAFRTCAKAQVRKVAGITGLVGLVGSVRSEYGAGSAQVVLLTRSSRVVWAQLDGSGWESGERERALKVLVTRLL